MAAAGEDTIKALREAVRVSPDNVPLRKHLAETCLAFNRLEEAEREYREAIGLAPGDHGLKLGLAKTYLRRGRSSHALVIFEELSENAPQTLTPEVRVLFATALVRTGETERASAQYRRAVEADPAVADEALAEELGVAAKGGRGAAEVDDDDEDDERIAVLGSSSKGSGAAAEIERPKITFAEIGGMEKVKEEIRLKIIHPLEHPDLYKAYGKKTGGGILMYGPPGCGKTHLARATAGQVKARFIAVGINDVLNMWMGESEKNLHEIFEQARQNTPCVLFFDEVDALGASRTDLRHSAGRQLVNQFLSELDGMNADNEGLLILAATNAPWHIDPAFRRPGRFDRIIFVPPPDLGARAAICRIMLTGKPTDNIDADSVARKTEGFSGADIKNMIDVAIEGKLREAMAKGRPEPLTTRDLLAAAKGLKPTAQEWFSTARNYALYSNQGGLYDDVLEHLKLR